ncbi:hypothetical protein MCAV_02250 [[Mycoplasma] cavipharyngis]|uniref:Mbov_0396 family ICE element transmembrane protein n=1 Tax=[Mycoplasma] cavipharyngis TaxID=92757 RepID=UPI003704893B
MGWFFDVIGKAIGTVFEAVFQKIIAWFFWNFIITPILQIMDGVEKVFTWLSQGLIQKLVYNGDLSNGFQLANVTTAFWIMLSLAIVLGVLILCANWVVSFFRDVDRQRLNLINGSKFLLLGVFGVFILPLLLWLSIYGINAILHSVIKQAGGGVTISDQMYYLGANPKTKVVAREGDYSMPDNWREYNYILQIFGLGFVFVGLGMLVFLVAAKTWDIFFLFLISPFIVMSTTVDHGRRMKLWLESISGKILGIGFLPLGFTLFNIYIKITTSILNDGSFPEGNALAHQVAKLVIIVAGVLGLQNIGQLIATFIGEKMGIQEAAETSNQMKMIGAMAVGGVALVGKAAKGARRLIGGQRSKEANDWMKKTRAENIKNGLGRNLTDKQKQEYHEKFGMHTRGGLLGLNAKVFRFKREQFAQAAAYGGGLGGWMAAKGINRKLPSHIKKSMKMGWARLGKNQVERSAEIQAGRKMNAQEWFKKDDYLLKDNKWKEGDWVDEETNQFKDVKGINKNYHKKLNELMRMGDDIQVDKKTALLNREYQEALTHAQEKARIGINDKNIHSVENKRVFLTSTELKAKKLKAKLIKKAKGNAYKLDEIQYEPKMQKYRHQASRIAAKYDTSKRNKREVPKPK